MIAFLAAVVVLLLTSAIGAALLPRVDALLRSRWEGFALALVAGLALVAVAGTALLAAGCGFQVVEWVFLGGGVLALGVLARGSARLSAQWSGSDSTRAIQLRSARRGLFGDSGLSPHARALLLILGVGAVLASVSVPINFFDPLLHFAYKGKVLFHGGEVIDPALTALSKAQPDGGNEFGRMVTHPNYPFGLPLLEALCARLAGEWDARWVKLPLAFWSLCLPAAVHFGLRSVAPRAAALGALLTAATPMLYARDFLSNGYKEVLNAGVGHKPVLGAGADLPVAAMIATACALLLAARRQSVARARLAWIAGLCLGGAVMMKNEGLAMFGVVALALGLAGALIPRGAQRGAARASLLALLVAVACVVPWMSLRAELPAIDENYAEHFTPERIWHFLSGGDELVEKNPAVIAGQSDDLLANPPKRISLLPGYFLLEFVDVLSWGFLWILFFLCLPLSRSSLRDPDRRWLALAVLGAIACYFLILLVTPWYLPLLREKGIPERLLLHMVGPAAMLVAWQLSTRFQEDNSV